MHRLLIACVAGAALMTAAMLPDRADAMPLAPGAPLTLNHGNSLADQVAYVCRPAWRCGPWGCGWRRACFWRPGPFAYYGPYRRFYRPYAFARPFGYRPWGYRRYW